MTVGFGGWSVGTHGGDPGWPRHNAGGRSGKSVDVVLPTGAVVTFNLLWPLDQLGGWRLVSLGAAKIAAKWQCMRGFLPMNQLSGFKTQENY